MSMKTLLVVGLLIAAACANLECVNDAKFEVAITRKNQTTFFIPPDDGASNFGDNDYGQRENGDGLLLRQIEVNSVDSTEQSITWKGRFDGYAVTYLRVMNFGRQRGYVTNLYANTNGDAYFDIGVRPYDQFRIIIEIFGYKK